MIAYIIGTYEEKSLVINLIDKIDELKEKLDIINCTITPGYYGCNKFISSINNIVKRCDCVICTRNIDEYNYLYGKVFKFCNVNKIPIFYTHINQGININGTVNHLNICIENKEELIRFVNELKVLPFFFNS